MFIVSCPTPSNCNCDRADVIARSDEGTILDKQFLPVSALHFKANVDSNSIGNVNLGDLQCDGIGKTQTK